MPNADGQMNHPKIQLLTEVLKGYDLTSTVAKIAGLACVPRFQANSYRVEILSMIAVACCEGSKRATWQHFRTWLNRQLGSYEIACMEDPAEDVFVVNVVTAAGEFRVLGGLWEAGESATTLLYEALTAYGGKGQRAWLQPATALLRLSDAMVSRSGLERWQMEPSKPKAEVLLGPSTPIDEWSHRVTFTSSELNELGIDTDDLSHFVFDLNGRKSLLNQNNQESDLHRRPLLNVGDVFVVAIPTAVTYAVRRFIVDQAARFNQLATLQTVLAASAQRRAERMAAVGSRHSIQGVDIPQAYRNPESEFQSVVKRVGEHRFLHFVLQIDDLEQVLSTGFLGVNEPSASTRSDFNEHIASVRGHVHANYDVHAGYTFWLPGVLGQAFMGVPPTATPLWTFEVARLCDLEMLFRDSSDPIDRVMLLMHQKQELELQGLELPNHNGLLNLYAYWSQQGFHLRGSDMPHDHPLFVQIGTDYVAQYRADRRRAVDEHCELMLSGSSTIVQRTNSESEYQVVLDVPAYVSLSQISSGLLSFCLKHRGAVFWLTMRPPTEKGTNSRVIFELWEALQLFVHRAFTSTFLSTSFQRPVVEVTLDFSSLVSQPKAVDDATLSATLSVTPAADGAVVVTCGPGFLRNFDGVSNNGEQYLLSELLRALVRLADVSTTRPIDYSSEANRILGGTDARVLHTFRYWSDVEFLIAANSRRRYQAPKEHIQSSIRSAFTWMESPKKPTAIDIKPSVTALNSAVTNQVVHLTSALSKFNVQTLIRELLHRHETLLREKHRWRATARAVRGLYGVEDGTGVASSTSQEYAQLQICLRALIEAAVCECDKAAGMTPDDFQIDELVGQMATINELGRSSDVLYYDLSDGGITLYPNGSYSLNTELLSQISTPYLMESFGVDYAKSSADYESWAGNKEETKESQEESIFDSPAFLKAWEAEYNHSFEAFRAIAGALQNMAVLQQDIVVEVAIEDIKPEPEAYAFTATDVYAFVEAFSLQTRPTWLAQPPTTLPKEINPWRFQRRLSLMLKPMVALGPSANRLIYGVGTLREALAYVLDSVGAATFDKDVFRSKEMRSFLGTCVDELGRRFTEHVAEQLRKAGWHTKTELKLTQLLAPKTPNLGDIDVLAWRSDGSVLVIECKRLKQSKTIAEIALACQRFAGNVGDHLHKHLRRVEWVKENIPMVAKFTKLDATIIRIYTPLVVSRPVPFKYLQSLPLQPSDIVSIDTLEEYTATIQGAVPLGAGISELR
jgi:hypothetical protein